MRVRAGLAGVLASILSGLLPGSALSADRWEGGTISGDDDNSTFNVLRHGLRQANHDVEPIAGTPDQDWYRVKVQRNHSYEVRASSGTAPWEISVGADAQLDRVDSAGVVLTNGLPGDDDPAALGQYATGHTIRWIAPADATEFLRVCGCSPFVTAEYNYDIEMFDTTYSVARWNNSATQVTVFLLRNTSTTPVIGNVIFYNEAGTLIYTHPFNIAGNGLLTLITATIGALAGQGGSAAIPNFGGYGVLSGKAVSVETATGFSFDTPIQPFPR